MLRKAGSQATLILPDAPSRKAIFPEPQDPARRPASAKAGLSQGTGQADQVKAAMA